MNDYIIDNYLNDIDRMSEAADNQPPMPSLDELEAEHHAMLRNPDSTRADFMYLAQIWHAIAVNDGNII